MDFIQVIIIGVILMSCLFWQVVYIHALKEQFSNGSGKLFISSISSIFFCGVVFLGTLFVSIYEWIDYGLAKSFFNIFKYTFYAFIFVIMFGLKHVFSPIYFGIVFSYAAYSLINEKVIKMVPFFQDLIDFVLVFMPEWVVLSYTILVFALTAFNSIGSFLEEWF